MVNITLVFISVCLAVTGQFLMKHGMDTIGKFSLLLLPEKIIGMFLNPFVFAGLSCFVLGAILWLVILPRMELSYVYPMVAFGYVIAVFISAFIFKENVTWLRWLGVATISLGVILISRS